MRAPAGMAAETLADERDEVVALHATLLGARRHAGNRGRAGRCRRASDDVLSRQDSGGIGWAGALDSKHHDSTWIHPLRHGGRPLRHRLG